MKTGHVFKACPPLYKIVVGNEDIYLYSDKELEQAKKKYKTKIRSQMRYKGLGEMDSGQLWETTMDPKARRLVQLTLNDAIEAENMTKIYMGTKVDQRKENIMNLATDESVNIDY